MDLILKSIISVEEINQLWLLLVTARPASRLNMIEALRKYIDVDIYGKCGQDKQMCEGAFCWSLLNEHKLLKTQYVRSIFQN